MENLRKLLINWNVAPLLLVAFLSYLEWLLVNDLITRSCEVDPMNYGAIAVLIAAIGGILFKMYDKMQKNNKVTKDDSEEE